MYHFEKLLQGHFSLCYQNDVSYHHLILLKVNCPHLHKHIHNTLHKYDSYTIQLCQSAHILHYALRTKIEDYSLQELHCIRWYHTTLVPVQG